MTNNILIEPKKEIIFVGEGQILKTAITQIPLISQELFAGITPENKYLYFKNYGGYNSYAPSQPMILNLKGLLHLSNGNSNLYLQYIKLSTNALYTIKNLGVINVATTEFWIDLVNIPITENYGLILTSPQPFNVVAQSSNDNLFVYI